MPDLLALSQTAGVLGFALASASLALGVKNYLHTRDAPMRQEQRELRVAFRDQLFKMRRELLRINQSWEDGNDFPEVFPESIVELQAELPRYYTVIQGKTKNVAAELEPTYDRLEKAWAELSPLLARLNSKNDPQGRHRAKLERRLSDVITELAGQVDLVAELIALENELK